MYAHSNVFTVSLVTQIDSIYHHIIMYCLRNRYMALSAQTMQTPHFSLLPNVVPVQRAVLVKRH